MKIRRMDEMGITVLMSNAENRRFEVPPMRDWEPDVPNSVNTGKDVSIFIQNRKGARENAMQAKSEQQTHFLYAL